MSGVRAVLFDAVGTLIRPDPPVAAAYYSVARRFGSRLTQEEIAGRFAAAFAASERRSPAPGEKPLPAANEGEAGGERESLARPATSDAGEIERWRQIVAHVLDDLPDATGEPFEALWRHFADPRNWRLFEDAAPAWQALEAAGLTIGVASNFDGRLLELCRALPPLNRSPHLFYSARVGWPKPSPSFFAHVERALGLLPHQVLLIGDDYENDYRGARAAGWRAIHLDRQMGSVNSSARSARNLDQAVAWILDHASRGHE